MSTEAPVTAPVATPEPAAPAPAAVEAAASKPRPTRPSSREIAQRIADKVNGSAPTEAPAAEAPATPPPVEAAKAEVAPDPAEISRIARLQRSHQEAERKRVEAEQRAKDLETKHAELSKTLEKLKGNPIEALKHLGIDYGELTKGIVEGKYAPPTAEQLAIDGTRSELEQIKADLAREREERSRAAREQTMAQRQAELAEQLKGPAAEHFPALSALAWAPKQLLAMAEKDPDTPLDEHARTLETHVLADLEAALTSERALKVLAGKPALREKVLAAFGADKPKTQAKPDQQDTPAVATPGNGPRTITNEIATQSATRSQPGRPTSRQERLARAIAAAKTA